MLIDSHCHLPLLELSEEEGGVAEVLDAGRENGVTGYLCVAIDLEGVTEIRGLARDFAPVFASAGIHPNHVYEDEPGVAEIIAAAAAEEVVAVGETGLDYFRSDGDLEWQRDRFRRHIAAARELGKPLIIHTRDAKEDVIRVLQEENAAEVGGVMHCFVEDWDTALAAMEMGFYISISGIVTFRNAESLREVARKIPDDRLLVETDSPYLAPVPKRGKPNRPAYVRHVAEFLAELREQPFEDLAAYTTANFYRLFPLAAS